MAVGKKNVLTRREQEVVELSQTMKPAAIAARLGIAENTVITYLREAKIKHKSNISRGHDGLL